MTHTLALLLLLALAQDAKPAGETTVAPPKDTSDLVEASKAAKAAKATSSKKKKKVITNADVKKSSGKLIEYTPPPLPDAEVTVTNSVAAHQEKRKARLAAEERFAAAEKNVAELQKELSRVETAFYEENDPNYRDQVIEKKFAQTKRQLDAAKQELADARDLLDRTPDPNVGQTIGLDPVQP